ncbi:MAG: Helix-turn-helix protein [Amycolatopsis sp.]|uniref:helix-turn-helix domain-containing protein n=1 Tax=Amycolatopsis sp. TaxID=37632 RepID=UPI00263528AA|nr:helix-turn-helix transcriptional regulator [Amycolatopsis sp.]MCU1684815.1 Helix-turn-helix protein [Amycolatopsis sp.]
MDTYKPNARMRLLGRRLRRLREQMGMTQEQAGEPLRFSKAKMSRVEQGVLPGYHSFLAMLDLYGIIVSDYETWLLQYDRAKEKGWWHAYGINDRGYIGLQADAEALRTYQLGYIPGLFQTEDGIRATFAGARDPMTGEKLENQVKVRLRRQLRLVEEPPLMVHAIIDETVLRRPDLPPDQQREQLTYLVELGERSNVTLQVIPVDIGVHAGRAGSFTILSYQGLGEPDIAYVEHGFGSVQVEKVDEVKLATLAFRHLADLAFDEQDSIALIKQVTSET